MSKATERVPSLKSLLDVFAHQLGEARIMIARGIMKGKIHPLAIKKTEEWVRSCHNRPSFHEMKMDALNNVLMMHGVEDLVSTNYGHVCEYLNSGDTYNTTILYYNGRYHLGDWGSLVESMERRGYHF
jgi:hypothetical protein